MKRLGFFILALLVCGVGFSQSGYIVDGKSGIKGRIDPSGKYLSVVDCRVGSPADIQGIGSGDKIYQINGIDIEKIYSSAGMFGEKEDNVVVLTISKRGSNEKRTISFKRLEIDLENGNFKTEAELFRSQVLAQRRRTDSLGFETMVRYIKTLPKGTSYSASKTGNLFYIHYNLIGDLLNYAAVNSMKDISRNISSYKTYYFDFSSKDNPLLEKNLFSQLAPELRNLGMMRDSDNPDLLIIINFYAGVQSQYIPPQQIISTKIKSVFNWYWGYIPVPVTESKIKEGYNITNYLSSISLKILDAKEIETSKTPPVVWSGSILRTSRGQSFLNEVSPEYFKVLMSQYPEVWRENANSYLFSKYAYTGIIYSSVKELVVADLISGSPAERAGLQRGDVISDISLFGQNGANDNSSFYAKHDLIAPEYFYVNGFAKFNNSWEGYFEPVANLFADFDFTAGAKVLFKVKRGKSKMEFELVPEMKEVMFLDNLGRHM